MKTLILLGLFCFALVGRVCSQNPVEKLSLQFANWQKSFPQVKVFSFFNQKKYVPGDTAFFKTYFLTEQLARVGGRQILRLSLMNSAGQEVGRSDFGVKDGVGHNQFVLPDSLDGGYYRFTIFNDWMKNFNSSLYFQQEIEVVRKNKVLHAQPVKNTMKFFPEGGTLVTGISNKIVLRADGLPDSSGDLVDANGNVITSFKIDPSGFGFVVFTPKPGMKYSARIKEQRFDLPPCQSDGLALLLTPRADRSPVRILISAPPNSNFRQDDLIVMLTLKGEIYYTAVVRLEAKDFVQVVIPQADLPSGVAQLTILTGEGKNIASRLFAVKGNKQVVVSLKSKKPVVGTREKISLDLTLTDEAGKALAGEFLVSAINERLFGADSLLNFAEDLTVFNEFSSAEIPFDRTHSSGFRALDHWLITQKWDRFDWDKIQSPHPGQLQYGMNTMLSKKGKAFHPSTGQPVPDSTLIVLYLQKHTIGYQAYTERQGQFELPFLFDFWGTDEIFYVAEQQGKETRDVKVEWLPDSLTASPAHAARTGEGDDDYSIFASKKKLIDNSYHFYSRPSEVKPDITDPNAEFEDELMGADLTVNVQDYIIFPTMIEVIREIIPFLQHRKLGGKTSVTLVLSDPTILTTGDPLYVIDGVMTKDTEFFLGLNPADVLTIKIVRDLSKLRRLGAIGKNGIVLVQTKKPDLQKLRSGSTTLPVAGLQRAIEFKAQDHSKNSDVRVPDFRSTLFWAPSLKTDPTGKANFSFFASDDTSAVIVKVLGMTSDGRPFSTFIRVPVNYQATAGQK